MARNKYPEETVKLILDVAARLFAEKGYDRTSLQDIINETKLSKGAIYHHFASKEDILEAIFDRIGAENTAVLAKVRDDKTVNGLEKLRSIIRTAVCHANQSLMLTITPDLLENPRFLSLQISQIYEMVAPNFIEPILRQGMEDGSIPIEHPKEIAETIMILTNIWLNPLVNQTDAQGMRERCNTFNHLMSGIGIGILLDEDLIEAYSGFCKQQ